MEKSIKRFLIIIIFVVFVFKSVVIMASGPRQRINIDYDWRFKLGDVKGADVKDFDDSDWRILDLPHDWSIEGEYRKENLTSWRGGYLPAGIGWYRKELEWKKSWEGKKVIITFDGVYMNSDVWINGHHLGNRPYGYITFTYDITPYLKKGKNVLAVRVDNSKVPSGRWYTGSGIYRHVWLSCVHPIHIAQWGTYVTTPHVSKEKTSINIQTTILNESSELAEVDVWEVIYNQNRRMVGESTLSTLLAAQDSLVVDQTIWITDPQLWSPNSPYLYSVETRIIQNGNIVDRTTSPLGIRTIEVSAEWGFKLNGEQIYLKGVCNHHDGGPVGAAVPEGVLLRRLKLLKAMGCNAIRTAHNPRRPEFYDLCDSLGIMVMDEAFDGWREPKAKHDYGHYFEEWWERDLTAVIKRDRNHPCVVIWSLGNEVRGFEAAWQKKMSSLVRKLDPTRHITQGRGHHNKGKYLDIAGFNGHGEEKGELEVFHQEYPKKPVVGTEMTHALQTRGVYRTQTWYRRRDFPAPWELGKPWNPYSEKVTKVPDLTEEEVFTDFNPIYQSSYDNSIVRIGDRDVWKLVKKYDFFMGIFRWTGFDYLGEANRKWPARSGNKGIIDLCGFPKDVYYLYQSLWTEEPMLHILPHWTWPGKEGVKIPVVVYTNCDRVELFLNGESVGEKVLTEELQLVWKVPYQPGILKAVAKRDGKVVAEKTRVTAGKPYRVVVTPDKKIVQANHRDVIHLEVDIVDRDGTLVPDADNLVIFNIEGPAKLIGVGNGDILDHSSHKVNYRKTFMGKCLGLIQSTNRIDDIKIIARSEGLKPDTVIVRSE